MRSISNKASTKIEKNIQARCRQVRDGWSESEKTIRRLWAQMAQRRLLSATVARELAH